MDWELRQTQGTSSPLDAGEILHVSDIQVTNINFTGSVAGYIFSNPTITNFGINVLRSGAGTDFNEATENAGLYSVPPAVSGNPTIGFGDGALGTGDVQSNVKIENGFAAAGTAFTNRYLGAWDFKMLAGSMGLKGVGLQYNLGYDIALPFRRATTTKTASSTPPTTSSGPRATSPPTAMATPWSTRRITISGAANFGNPNPPGAGSGGLAGSAVPEPASVGMLILGLLGSCIRRRSGRSQL